MAKTIHTLKVTLREVKPPVWRRIEVPSELRLSELAPILEAAMGWLGSHLHMYDAEGTIYDMHHPELEPLGLDESDYSLDQLLPNVGMKMRWEYDFGDGWEHNLLVEAISLRKSKAGYPVCLAGRRSCPPEDCGGPWGYQNMLEALADPHHSDHDVMVEWAPLDFDPGRFNIDETTEAMRSPRPIWGL